MTASCSDLQLWILAWEESLLPFTPISLLALLGKSQRRNLIGCLGHVLMTKPITIIEEALGSPVWITSLFHPMTREAGSSCLGLGSEWVSPQENNCLCTFLLPGGVHAPAHPFFPSPSRAYGEGLETEVHHSYQAYIQQGFTEHLLSTCTSPGLSFLLCTNKVRFTLQECVCPANHPSEHLLYTEDTEMRRQSLPPGAHILVRLQAM